MKFCSWVIRVQYSCTCFISCLTRWKWMTLPTLRFTLRLGIFALRSTDLRVYICILKQALCVKTKSTLALFSTQPELSIPMRKFPLTCIIIPHCPFIFYPVRRPCCADRNVRCGSQTTHRDGENLSRYSSTAVYRCIYIERVYPKIYTGFVLVDLVLVVS